MGGERRVGMLEVVLLCMIVVGSLELPSMAAGRPLRGKLGFEVEALFLESLPKGSGPPSEHSCETHSNIACPKTLFGR
ncbi:hypothetical protein MA16_Dca000368 [Dendrobium catenatum]|uniref:Uncharacterized protein n=1 Tax=Dendrobium catenatum TaxID=906689 RepID=A0A2I0WTN7_9ASPA|nr:hypothetical protein MA16_Dca000368 [Dendrobium catenatum]